MSKAETIHDPTDAAAVVGEQMRGRLGDLADRSAPGPVHSGTTSGGRKFTSSRS